MKPSSEAIEAALKVDTGIGQGASHDHGRYMYINAVLEAAYGVDMEPFSKEWNTFFAPDPQPTELAVNALLARFREENKELKKALAFVLGGIDDYWEEHNSEEVNKAKALLQTECRCGSCGKEGHTMDDCPKISEYLATRK